MDPTLALIVVQGQESHPVKIKPTREHIPLVLDVALVALGDQSDVVAPWDQNLLHKGNHELVLVPHPTPELLRVKHPNNFILGNPSPCGLEGPTPFLAPAAIPFPKNLNRRASTVKHHIINIEINRLLIYIYFTITQYPHTYVSASLNYIQSQNHFLLFILLSMCRLYAQFCNPSFVHIIAQRKIEVKRLVRFFLREGRINMQFSIFT